MLPNKIFKDKHAEWINELEIIRLKIIAHDRQSQNKHTLITTTGCLIPFVALSVLLANSVTDPSNVLIMSILASIGFLSLMIGLRWKREANFIATPTAEISKNYNHHLQKKLIPALLDVHPVQVTWDIKPQLEIKDLYQTGFQFLFKGFSKSEHTFTCHHRFVHADHPNTQKGWDCSLNFINFGIKKHFDWAGFAILYEHNFKINGFTALIGKNFEIKSLFGRNAQHELFDLQDLDYGITQPHDAILNSFTARSTKITHAYKTLSLPIFQAIAMFDPTDWKNMLVFFSKNTILFFIHNDLSSPLIADVNTPLIAPKQYERFHRHLQLFDEVSQKLIILN